jgi:hypothetical protein
MANEMPNVIVAFREKGITAIQRSERGIVLLVLEDDITKHVGPDTIYTVDDIPETISDESNEQIKLALMGYQLAPKKVIVYYIAKAADKTTQDYTDVLKKIENVRFDYLAIPGIADAKTMDIASWIKDMRTTKDTRVKAVLPNCPADNDGVINFTNSIIKTATKSYTAAQYCSRVAGLIAGTPLTISCTYAPAAELIEVETQTKDEMDARVGKGEFFFFSDGEKIKVARGVNSYVTTIQDKGEDFQKIKMIDIMDMIHDDIKKTGHDSYIGKYANSYDNRCLLITAINGYFHGLELDGLLEKDQNSAEIDIPATKVWLESNGLKTKDELAAMKDIQIKYANVHSNVFVAANLSILDAIENIVCNCTIE